ncbi:alpha/beta hydrolase [Cyanobacterium stanieri LEGE 03274]|uniref:Alpha/beta hydrolase n=1 Tax=Cyanobacterium stanieri LEGE 03274 TaxID=1828756 RepID=A0ABR9V7H2_9CHRO|nr:alpha/beta hydrolase [Cyanobacterium stanieri]MBE9223817.1 alpha/beta hydrolase [Cyanobacterium stanieri LEGE 03274]
MNINTKKGFLKIRDFNHYYEWIKQEDNQPKPVMVFIHGWGGSCRYWRTTARAIAPYFDCLLYDMRGFGQSQEKTIHDQTQSYELEEYAQDLVALLQGFNLEKVYLNSHSMGASIATLFLSIAPEKVEKAILTSNGIFTYNRLAFALFHQISEYVVKFRYNWLLKIPFAEKFFMARFLHQPIAKHMSIAFLEDFLMADCQTALHTIYTSVSKKSVETISQAYQNISLPTLLISGEKDQIIPANMGKSAALLNPEMIKYQVIKATGHFPMLEDSKTYLKVMGNFLNLEFN